MRATATSMPIDFAGRRHFFALFTFVCLTFNMLRSHLQHLAPALKRAHGLSTFSNAGMFKFDCNLTSLCTRSARNLTQSPVILPLTARPVFIRGMSTVTSDNEHKKNV
jgi:hypothetical protein